LVASQVTAGRRARQGARQRLHSAAAGITGLGRVIISGGPDGPAGIRSNGCSRLRRSSPQRRSTARRAIASPGLPRWPPAHPGPGHIRAGKNDLGRRPPEPCAQVRILLGALLGAYFSNKTSADCRSDDKPLTCANADVINFPRPAGARDGRLKGANLQASDFRSYGCQAVAATASTGSAPRRYEHACSSHTARPESRVTGPAPGSPQLVAWSPRQMPGTACASGPAGRGGAGRRR
jgi:hypothetical protein